MSIRTLCIAIISIVVGYLLIGQNLQAKFFYIDDHEIPFYLNGKERMELKDFNQALAKTEFYGFGKGARFRPAYSFFRITETALWGDNPFLWYASRLIMFIFSFFVFWIILKRYVGIIPGFLIIMYTLTFPFWTDIWARMGPGEVYCVPALSLFIWSYLNILEGKRTYLSWMVLATASFSIVGSKETFAFLIFFILFLDGYLYSKKGFDINAAIYSFISLLLIGYVLVGVGLYVYNTGNDFYLNSVGPQSRIMNVWTTLCGFSLRIWNKVYPNIFYPGIIVGSFIFWWISKHIRIAKKSAKKEFFQAFYEFMVIIGLMSFVVISQIYFYNGTWPTRMRYDFPGLLFIPVGIIASYRFLQKIFILCNVPILYRLLPYITGLLLLVAIGKTGYQPLRMASDANAARTNEFTLRMQTIKNDLHEKTDIPIVYESCNPTDFEFVTSLNRFLYSTINGRLLYLWTDFSRNTDISPLNTDLAESLTTLSRKGNAVFKPIHEWRMNDACYSINVSCPTMHCTYGTSLVQPWCLSKNNPFFDSPFRQTLPNSSCVL